jgi:hypothetical protein
MTCPPISGPRSRRPTGASGASWLHLRTALGWEIRRGIEDPGQYVIRIEWDSVDGHMRGFRESEPFQDFYGELSAFAEYRLQMSHFERV